MTAYVDRWFHVTGTTPYGILDTWYWISGFGDYEIWGFWDFGKNPFGRVPGHSWQWPFFPRITGPWNFAHYLGDIISCFWHQKRRGISQEQVWTPDSWHLVHAASLPPNGSTSNFTGWWLADPTFGAFQRLLHFLKLRSSWKYVPNIQGRVIISIQVC